MNIEKTMENLKGNNMTPYFAETKEDALKLLESLLKEGETVSVGGSVTLGEIGALVTYESAKKLFLKISVISSLVRPSL